MQLKESIQKTNTLFHKSVQKLKSMAFGGYQKLQTPTPCNPFSCGSCRRNMRSHHQGDHYYTEFCNEWECDLEKVMQRKNASVEDVSNESSMRLENSPVKKKELESGGGGKEVKNKKSTSALKKGEQCSKSMNGAGAGAGAGAGYALAKKMKELEMIDVSDVEHVLDVEEALHYYSRLKSPVYLDIVDDFFTNMYSEFSIPRPSASINNSKRRLGSIRF